MNVSSFTVEQMNVEQKGARVVVPVIVQLVEISPLALPELIALHASVVMSVNVTHVTQSHV